jgi:hypothetical protein
VFVVEAAREPVRSESVRYRRPIGRYDLDAEHFTAFTVIACA